MDPPSSPPPGEKPAEPAPSTTQTQTQTQDAESEVAAKTALPGMMLGSLFDDDDDSDEEEAPPQLLPRKPVVAAPKPVETAAARRPVSPAKGSPRPTVVAEDAVMAEVDAMLPELDVAEIFDKPVSKARAPAPALEPEPEPMDEDEEPPAGADESAAADDETGRKGKKKGRITARQLDEMRRETERLARDQRVGLESAVRKQDVSAFLARRIQAMQEKQQLQAQAERERQSHLVQITLSDSEDDLEIVVDDAAPAPTAANPFADLAPGHIRSPAEHARIVRYKMAVQAAERRKQLAHPDHHHAASGSATASPVTPAAPVAVDPEAIARAARRLADKDAAGANDHGATWDSEEEGDDGDYEMSGSDADGDDEEEDARSEHGVDTLNLDDDEEDDEAVYAVRRKVPTVVPAVIADSDDDDEAGAAGAAPVVVAGKRKRVVVVADDDEDEEDAVAKPAPTTALAPPSLPGGWDLGLPADLDDGDGDAMDLDDADSLSQLFVQPSGAATPGLPIPASQVMDHLRRQQHAAADPFALPLNTQEAMLLSGGGVVVGAGTSAGESLGNLDSAAGVSFGFGRTDSFHSMQATPPPTESQLASAAPKSQRVRPRIALDSDDDEDTDAPVFRRVVTKGEKAEVTAQARGMLETEAVESEDEFMGVDGADEDERMLDLDAADPLLLATGDEAAPEVALQGLEDVRELVKAQRAADDDAATRRLEADLLGGGGGMLGLARRQRMDMLGKGYGLEELDDEDEDAYSRGTAGRNHHRRPRKKAKVAEAVATLAEDPRTAAFARALTIDLAAPAPVGPGEANAVAPGVDFVDDEPETFLELAPGSAITSLSAAIGNTAAATPAKKKNKRSRASYEGHHHHADVSPSHPALASPGRPSPPKQSTSAAQFMASASVFAAPASRTRGSFLGKRFDAATRGQVSVPTVGVSAAAATAAGAAAAVAAAAGASGVPDRSNKAYASMPSAAAAAVATTATGAGAGSKLLSVLGSKKKRDE
ncbi:hypothetical protein H9P43_004131 [Blastocladiella emersonii ATCC 22665]|nr:hypothetical protein H9P43_004131 [Blastocladiella emersonii ATCC 22665]